MAQAETENSSSVVWSCSAAPRLSRNRAAEQAAPATDSIFKDAIKQMTFANARSILTGGDTTATNYFQEKTSDQLKSPSDQLKSRSGFSKALKPSTPNLRRELT
jgi:hypothetical protein